VIEADLTRHPGVHRRADSGIYQFGLRAPNDLLHLYKGGWAVRCSLKTADLREANRKAKEMQAQWAARFDALRTGQPAPFDAIALRTRLLDRVERSVRAADGRWATMAPDERLERAESLSWQLADMREGISDGCIPDWAEDALKRWGYERSPAADAEAVPFLILQLQLNHEALTDETRTFPLRVERLNAHRALLKVTAPAEQTHEPSARPDARHKILDAFDVWAEAPRPEKTVNAFRRHAVQFAEMMDNPGLGSFDRQAALAFRDKLQAWAVSEGKTARTADNILVSVRALANVAKDKGWVQHNPFDRLTVEIGGKDSEGREPWTHDELAVLFDDPIWQGYCLPQDKKAGVDAAYWIPLIACYTGGRLSEIAQLWTDDLSLTSGKETFEFRNDASRSQALKTANSWRAVPMHSELVRLGLPEYVASLSLGPLFPALPTSGKNGAGGQFGQWFGAFKRGKGFDTPAKSMHSFRHLVATELRLAGATDAQADAITGHSGVGIGRNVYAATIRREAERLRPTIERLSYSTLSLSKVLLARRAG